ncbi:hypothetical protein [Nocardia sp. NPDC052566]|uniref:hypothetical protein n=1 Tax=Nocardia sp. NPDC052566 TaxID=3364330 RepID=UPI0037C70254
MVFSTIKSRRALARVAVAGAIAAFPLTALAIPASAEPLAIEPSVTEVGRWNDYCDRNWWDNRCAPQQWWDNQWNDCRRDMWGNCDRPHHRHHQQQPWQQFFPRGSFGSS